MSGRVYLIGAGPGDPKLLTLRGAECLARADVVLYDGLSNAQMLVHAPAAQHICVGKHGQSRIWKQQEINEEILRHAGEGKTVARLKGGDPAVFARTAEEVEAVLAADIPLEVVPGITAALAAGSYAGIPITHRKLASAVALVTGHEEPGKSESAIDWDALARFPGTLVIYMGVTSAPQWTQALLDCGKPADTPAAIIRRCSLPDQVVIRCRLDQVADQLTPTTKLRPPVIVILGAVATLADTADWLGRRPLFGQTILVTRPIDQSEALAEPLRELGANVVLQPAIKIGPPLDWSQVDQAIEVLPQTDLVVFCSHNGVRYFLERLLSLGKDVRAFGNTQIAVVGSKTAHKLEQFSLRADFVPSDFRAESLAKQLSDNTKGKRVTIVRASRGRDTLADALVDAGASVTQVTAYTHSDVEQADPGIVGLARAGKIDWVTVTSSATAASISDLLGSDMRRMKIASLSPVTSASLADLGFDVTVEADPYTIESLVQAISTFHQVNRDS